MLGEGVRTEVPWLRRANLGRQDALRQAEERLARSLRKEAEAEAEGRAKSDAEGRGW